jgi:hypothetical protein
VSVWELRRWTLGGLLLFGVGAAQQFSGPDQARAPRSAEAFALGKAVCEANIWLGPLTGCQLYTYPGSSLPELRGKTHRFVPVSVLFGSFSAPNTREVLAQFCTETESCLADAVLLRQNQHGFTALGSVRGFDLGRCLIFPARPHQSAAICLGTEDLGEAALKTASWPGGRLQVRTSARFGLLRFAAPDSLVCRSGVQVSPLLWEDRDRDVNGQPDLTLAVTLDRSDLAGQPCSMAAEGGTHALNSVRVDLPFHWTGSALVPTGATPAFLARYSLGLNGAQP